MIVVIIVGVVALLLAIYVWKNFKFPKCGNFIMIDGAVKSGKTTFGYALARKIYKRNLNAVKFRNFLIKVYNKLFNKQVAFYELPLFYSTIPVAIPHVLLTKDLINRKKRFAFKSVIFVDEASLFADSTLVKNYELNENLLLFNKLIAHETHGGTIVFNSQAISDVHFSIRRCLSESFYVYDTCKWIPFFLVVTLREERYREDGQSINVYTEDVESSLKRVIIPKKVWKEFDCYCYSVLTDNLDVENTVTKSADLKSSRIVSFNPMHDYIVTEKGVEKIEKKDN